MRKQPPYLLIGSALIVAGLLSVATKVLPPEPSIACVLVGGVVAAFGLQRGGSTLPKIPNTVVWGLIGLVLVGFFFFTTQSHS